MEEGIVRYIHFVGIIVLSSMLVAENLMLSEKISFNTVNAKPTSP